MYLSAERLDGSMAAVFAALANPDRLAIVELLRAAAVRCPAGMSITAVAEEVGISRFAASRHLRVLAEAGLVEATASDRALLHRAVPSRFEQIEDWAYGLA